MEPSFNLAQYLTNGVERLVKEVLRATVRNPKASAFFTQYALSSKQAARRRQQLEAQGEHIPSFLICSITNQCNLHCAGCYDRANQSCERQTELTRADWSRIFKEAGAVGISVILLAGGEPMLRPDVIEEATRHRSILFPVFTNGTVFTDQYLALFEQHRNLIPIVSIEGDAAQTDARRGDGIYAQTVHAMELLCQKKLLFGASITVTKENLADVTSPDFIAGLRNRGCQGIVFVEYVPIEQPALALNDAARAMLASRVSFLREQGELIVVSFPGDEVASGGCLAAGRGFFHINAAGGAEPCPFSPYSDTNLKAMSLRDALRSPLFQTLQTTGALMQEHAGGCTLFAQANSVQMLAAANKH